MRKDLLKNFVANGLKVNPPEKHDRSECKCPMVYMDYPIFKLMSKFSSETDPDQRKSNEDFIKSVIECGADVNSA